MFSRVVNLEELRKGNIAQQHTLRDYDAFIDHLDVQDSSQCFEGLYRLICQSRKMDAYNDAISAMLTLGSEHLGCEYLMLLHPISDKISEVIGVNRNDNAFFLGQHVAIMPMMCGQLIHENEIYVEVDRPLDASQMAPMSYNMPSIGRYVGIQVDSDFYGKCVLGAVYTQTQQSAVSPESKALLQRLAEGIAYMTDLQKSSTQRKISDLSAFADGSIKTLDEYLEQARLPEVLGVPARVLEVLQQRIGQKPLGITYIADELNLSKRTLQRRLQQQSINFADLRDQVRFHYSIDYLIKQHMSIDSISTSLDFSDRTSFTNAFKRWTGLSPSTFRKLFRDYV